MTFGARRAINQTQAATALEELRQQRDKKQKDCFRDPGFGFKVGTDTVRLRLTSRNIVPQRLNGRCRLMDRMASVAPKGIQSPGYPKIRFRVGAHLNSL